MKKVRLLLTLFLMLFSTFAKAGDFTAGNKTFLLNGEPFIVKAAEVHYPRIPRPYWEHRIKMCKALGMNTLCIYVFWNIHEQREGEFDFTGNNDVAEFCRLAQKNGMYLCLCGVGDGWPALVALEEEGYPSARAGSLLHGARTDFREESR